MKIFCVIGGTVSRRLKCYLGLAQKRQVSLAVSARTRAVGSLSTLGLTEEWTYYNVFIS